MISFKQFYNANPLLKEENISSFDMSMLSECVVATGCTVRLKNPDNQIRNSLYFTVFLSRKTFTPDYFTLLALKHEEYKAHKPWQGQNPVLAPVPFMAENSGSHLVMTLSLYSRPDVLSGECPSDHDIHYYQATDLYQKTSTLELPQAIRDLSQASVLGSKQGSDMGKPEYYVQKIRNSETALLHQRIQTALYIENTLNPRVEKIATRKKI